MGKVSSEHRQTEIGATTHFSHPHPLLLISYHPIPNLPPRSCSACNLNPSGAIYSCTVCNFFLHKRCFEMPQKISHPFHKEHAFDLLPTPAYAEGVYCCDACKEAGSGFSYHCKPCGIDLHVLCAATPLSLANAWHPHHQLYLHFEPPYGDKCFSCGVCRGPGSNHWLYRCNLCGFDAHLKCARGAPPPVGNPANFMGFQAAAAATPYPMMNNNNNNNAAVGVPAAAAVSRQNEQLTTQFQAIMQTIHNNHAALAGGIGGGGGGSGGGGGLQQLTQLISNTGFGGGVPAGFNAFGGGGGGGGGGLQQLTQLISNTGFGGGGGVPAGFNAFGGGGGQDFVQALINGGGGGLDSLQSLLGGGGGGGFDFLDGIGNLF